MIEENGRTDGETEPIWEPAIIRCEATFHPAPGFEYLNHVPLGEVEACPIEPMIHLEMELKPVTRDPVIANVEFV